MEIIHIQHPHQLYNHRSVSSVAFGNFDGLHLGHQKVIQKAVKIAKEENLQSGVMTFYPHPKEVLGKVKNSSYLTPLPDKLKRIEELGVDFTMVITFALDTEVKGQQRIYSNGVMRTRILRCISFPPLMNKIKR
jgi:riboflavin kinase/FMN adenylyltransferase